VRSTERARRASTGRASEKQKRSDLICDRETSCPPASSSSPPFPPRRISTTFESTSFRTLRLPVSLAFPPLRALPIRSSSSSSPLSSLVVHEPLSRTEFIPPAKYPRVRLLISHSSSRFCFSPPPITILSASERIFPFIHFDSFSLFRNSCAIGPSDIFGLMLLRISI